MSKIYRGRRRAHNEDPEILVVTDGQEAPLRHVAKHSPTGMEWGYGGSGPADLARSILIDALIAVMCVECDGDGCYACDSGYFGVSTQLYQDFKWDVICKLPRSGFDLSSSDIFTWIERWRNRNGEQTQLRVGGATATPSVPRNFRSVTKK